MHVLSISLNVYLSLAKKKIQKVEIVDSMDILHGLRII